MSMKPLSCLFLCLFLGLLVACSSSDFHLNTHFSEASELKKGAKVILNNQQIGEVVSIALEDNRQRVELIISAESAKKISQKAIAVLGGNKANYVEIIDHGKHQAAMVENGQAIKGVDSLVGLGGWLLGDAIKIGAYSLSDYLDGANKYLSSEQFDKDKKVIEQQVKKMTENSQQVFTHLQTEIDSVLGQLDLSEKKMGEAIEKLGKELAPIAKELAKGGTEIGQQVEQLSQQIANQQEKGKQSGQVLLDSWMSMLEQLNQSIEQGLEEANENP